jgi:hypothetical protein
MPTRAVRNRDVTPIMMGETRKMPDYAVRQPAGRVGNATKA